MEIRFTPVIAFLLSLALIGAFIIMGFPLGVCVFLALAVVLYVGYAFPHKSLMDLSASSNRVTCTNCHYDSKKGALVCKKCGTRV